MDVEGKLSKVKSFYNLDENKFYHTINHIRTMLYTYCIYEDDIDNYYPSLNKELLIDMILWHDAGYVPGCKENEYEAASLYMKNNDYDYIVVEAIISTIPFTNKYENDYEKLIHDLDWFGFVDYNTMVENDVLIRNEYPDVDDATFFKNKYKFLNQMLEVYGKNLYVSEVFKNLNEVAYQNIQKRMKELLYEF
jgi:predicted metal-dependent HD superfamily phosphohydrolase